MQILDNDECLSDFAKGGKKHFKAVEDKQSVPDLIVHKSTIQMPDNSERLDFLGSLTARNRKCLPLTLDTKTPRSVAHEPLDTKKIKRCVLKRDDGNING